MTKLVHPPPKREGLDSQVGKSGPYFYNFVGTDNYVGLKWDIGSGDFLYGWARLDVTPDGMGSATLYSFAYETEPNTSILAGQVPVPEPGSLALLAAGGGAVALKRRRRSVVKRAYMMNNASVFALAIVWVISDGPVVLPSESYLLDGMPPIGP